MTNTVQIQIDEKHYNELLALIEDAEEDSFLEANQAGDEETYNEHKEGMHRSKVLHREITEGMTYLWSSGCGRLDLEIKPEHVEAIAQSGDNRVAIDEAIADDGYLRHQLNEMDMELAHEYVVESGAEPTDTNEETRELILWMACWDIKDGQEQ